MSLSDKDVARRIKAKRLNERLKLSANSVNTIGLTILAAAVLVPLTGGTLSLSAGIWILISAGLHCFGHLCLARLKSED